MMVNRLLGYQNIIHGLFMRTTIVSDIMPSAHAIMRSCHHAIMPPMRITACQRIQMLGMCISQAQIP